MTIDSQLASPHAGMLYLVEMQFTSGTSRFTTWTHSITWDGQTWLGFGGVVGVSQLSEGTRLEYPVVEVALNVANPAVLALALGNAAEYRGKPIIIRRGVLDDELKFVELPEVVWSGKMDQARIKTGDGEADEGGVAMRCEVPGRDGRGVQSMRLNNAQHQAQWPGDTFLSRIERLTGQPVPWLTKRFQRQ
jgi:hypothetical protein